MIAARQPVRPGGRRRRGGFTLVELLVTITIIAILASVLLGTLFFAGEKARSARTRSMIARLDQAITIRWESYRTRRVPIDPQAVAGPFGLGLDPTNPHHVSLTRLLALRELMRMELPDRWTDVTSDPMIGATLLAGGLERPALSRAYLERYLANIDPQSGTPAAPSELYQGAECLYLIVTMGGIGDDVDSADKFRSADVGDTDQDGMLEFLDGWGHPIRFLRWAPGFVSELQPDSNPLTVDDPSTPLIENIDRGPMNNHDPFDPLKEDLPESFLVPPIAPPKAFDLRGYENPFAGFRMFPLVYSPGPDGVADIRPDIGLLPELASPFLDYAALAFPNDPFHDPTVGGTNTLDRFIGGPFDQDVDGLNHLDNIHNHILGGTVR